MKANVYSMEGEVKEEIEATETDKVEDFIAD